MKTPRENKGGKRRPIPSARAAASIEKRSWGEIGDERSFSWNPDLLCVADFRGRLVRINPAWERLLGFEKKELLARPFWEWLRPDDLESAMEMVERLAHGKAVSSFEARLRRRDGAEKVVLWNAIPLEAGRRFFASGRDVTQQRHEAARIHQSEKMEAVGLLAGGIAHDFNNLLTVVQGHAGLLEGSASSHPEEAESIRQILKAAERASGLTRQLRMLGPKQWIERENFDPTAALREIAELLPRIVGEEIVVACECETRLPEIRADRAMFEQTVMNLAVNSRDAMPSGGRLTLTARLARVGEDEMALHPQARIGSFVVVSARDTGLGIDAEHIPRIFEPFFTTKEVGKGAGLGLATVYGILQQHGGWVEVESELGRGAAFHLHWPLASGTTDGAASRSMGEERVRGGGETILLVEDEAGVRWLVANVLRKHGYRVMEARSGVEALAVWKEASGKIDLLLSDMVMPGELSGRDLAEQLQEEEPALKILLTSGYGPERREAAATLDLRAAFLQKPYHPAKLIRAIRALLDSRESSGAESHPN